MMPRPVSALSERQLTAAAALAAGETRTDAGAAASVTRRTIFRWMADDVFRAAIAAERERLLSRATGILAHGCAAAARYLVAVASGEADGDAQRIMACRWTLQHAVSLGELVDLTARIVALEEREAA